MINNVQLSKYTYNDFSLVKDGKNYKALFKKFSKRLPNEKVDELLKKCNNSNIYYFIETMKKNGKEEYLENLYSNLANSKIINNKVLQKLILEKGVTGGSFLTRRNNYVILGNKEELVNNNAILTPYHELFHLITTSVEDESTARIGLQINDFGMGLNEGYTENLTKRYFGYLSNNDYEAYGHFTWFSNMLEEIIGKEKMEKYYFNMDMEGLVDELINYIPKSDVFRFIDNIDNLFISEDELFEIEKAFAHKEREEDKEIINTCYEVNRELLNKIYGQFLVINCYKESKLGIETDFKERNDLIKEKFDREEEIYQEYYKEEKGFTK